MSTSTNPISTAGFSSAPFDYNELYASETISRSGTITGFPANTLVKRGTVLFGNAVGVPQATAYSGSGAHARAILAADVMTPAAGDANCLVYIQGKFLESGMTFSVAGPTADAAGLWEFGIYVLDVMDRTGLMVPLPLDRFEQEEGKSHISDEGRKKAIREEMDKIRMARPQLPPEVADELRSRRDENSQPAWARVAFEDATKEAPRDRPPATQLPAPGTRPPATQLPAKPGHEHEKPGHKPDHELPEHEKPGHKPDHDLPHDPLKKPKGNGD